MLPEETVIVNVQATLSSYKPSPLASGDAIRPQLLEASTVDPHPGNIKLHIMCVCVTTRNLHGIIVDTRLNNAYRFDKDKYN